MLRHAGPSAHVSPLGSKNSMHSGAYALRTGSDSSGAGSATAGASSTKARGCALMYSPCDVWMVAPCPRSGQALRYVLHAEPGLLHARQQRARARTVVMLTGGALGAIVNSKRRSSTASATTDSNRANWSPAQHAHADVAS